MSNSCEIEIKAKPEQVFSYFNHPTNTLKWMEGLTAITRGDNYVDDSPVGGDYTMHIREGKKVTAYAAKVTSYDPPNYIAMDYTANGATFHNQYWVTETADGCHVTHSYEIETPDNKFIKLLAWAFNAFTKSIARKQLAKLKEVVEAELQG